MAFDFQSKSVVLSVEVSGGERSWMNLTHSLIYISHFVEGWLFWEMSTEIKQTHNNKPQSELSLNTGQPNLDVLSEA